MAYTVDYRKRVVGYRQEGHTLEETHETFKVAINTIRSWTKKLTEEGTLEKKPVQRQPRKIAPERLKAYVAAHPDAYLKEIAAEFKCCETAVTYALRRLKITRKKRQLTIRNKVRRR